MSKLLPPSQFAALEPLEIQIVDGRILAPDAALVEGFEFGVIEPGGSDPDFDSHPIVALNIALTRRAFGYRVKEGVVASIARYTSGTLTTKSGPVSSQVLGRADAGSRLTIIETFEGGAQFYSSMHHLGLHDASQVRSICSPWRRGRRSNARFFRRHDWA